MEIFTKKRRKKDQRDQPESQGREGGGEAAVRGDPPNQDCQRKSKAEPGKQRPHAGDEPGTNHPGNMKLGRRGGMARVIPGHLRVRR